MIRKFKNWLWTTFLPVWAKESLLKENQTLHEKNKALQDELDRLHAYVEGLEAGVRSHRRIIINNGGAVK